VSENVNSPVCLQNAGNLKVYIVLMCSNSESVHFKTHIVESEVDALGLRSGTLEVLVCLFQTTYLWISSRLIKQCSGWLGEFSKPNKIQGCIKNF